MMHGQKNIKLWSQSLFEILRTRLEVGGKIKEEEGRELLMRSLVSCWR